MNSVPNPSRTAGSLSNQLSDERLAELIEELSSRALRGEAIEVDLICDEHPDYADTIRDVLSTMEVLADWGEEFSSETDESPIPELPSRRLSDFRLLHEIGRGGMGVVYEAEQISLGRRVAIKVLPFAALLDPRQLQRFKNEARAAAMLSHPNIVSVFSVGCERGVHYYAMELIEGQTLQAKGEPGSIDRTGDGTEPPSPGRGGLSDTSPIAALSTQHSGNRKAFHRSVARLGIEAANALHYAHQEGVVHRDIKPSNILIDQEGQLFIADFGLARIQSGDDLTVTGDMVGTLRYMSPEQIAGKSVADHRTDIWSLGVTLYELLTGQPAFDVAERAALTTQILDVRPPLPSKIDRSVPRDLETIILKALEKDPNARYQSAEALAQDLQRFTDNLPIAARRVTRIERTRRWVMRNPAVASLLAITFVSLAVLAIGSTVVSLQFAKDARAKEFALYARDMRIARNLIEDGSFTDAERTLLAWAPETENDHDRMRGFEWRHLWNRCHHPAIKRTIKHRTGVFSVEYTGDEHLAIGWMSDKISVWNRKRLDEVTEPEIRLNNGSLIASVLTADPKSKTLFSGNFLGEIFEWDPKTGERLTSMLADTPRVNQHCWALSLQPEGNLLAVSVGGIFGSQVRIWDRDCHEFVKMWDFDSGRTFSEFVDKHTLLIATSNREIQLVDIRDYSVIKEVADELSFVDAMVIAPNKGVAVTSESPESDGGDHARLTFWDLPTLKVSKRVFVDSKSNALALHDQQLLAVGGQSGKLYLMDLDSGEVLQKQQGHSGQIYTAAFSPDGKELTTGGADGEVHLWDVGQLLARSNDYTQLEHGSSSVWGADFLDDETACISVFPGVLKIYNISTGNVIREIPIHSIDGQMYRTIISPDRRFIAVVAGHGLKSDKPGFLTVVDAEDDYQTRVYEIGRGVVFSNHEFSPDSRRVQICSKYGTVLIDVLEQKIIREDISAGETSFFKTSGFSADGSELIMPDTKGHLHFVDANTFDLIKSIRIGENALSFLDAEISPIDGDLLALVGFDRNIWLYDLATDQFRTIGDIPRYTTSVCFSPDGQRLLTGGSDCIIRLWHTKTGENLLQFELPRHGWYPSLAFSPNGNSIIAAAGRTVRIWSGDDRDIKTLSVAELQELSCQNIDYDNLRRGSR